MTVRLIQSIDYRLRHLRDLEQWLENEQLARDLPPEWLDEIRETVEALELERRQYS